MSLRIVKGGFENWRNLRNMIISPDQNVARQGFGAFLACANKFLELPDSPIMRAGLQEFAVRGHFPDAILEILKKWPEFKDYDMGYENIFDIGDYRGSGKEGFKLRTVSNGMAFNAVETGAKALVYGISGADISVSFAKFGAGLDLARELFEDEDYYSIENALVAFRSAEARKRAETHYALVEAVTSDQNTAWQTVTGDEPASDARTINSACNSIIQDLKDKGYNITQNQSFILLTPDTDVFRRRIALALQYTGQEYAGSPTQLSYNVSPIFTLFLTGTTNYYVILPKGKLVGGNRMDLNLFSQDGILSYSTTMAGWARYGGAVGEEDQIRRCAIS